MIHPGRLKDWLTSTPWLPQVLALLVIVGLGLSMRLNLVTGMIRSDDFEYAHTAYEMSQGYLHVGTWVGANRLCFYAPVSLLYTLFGASNTATLAWPMFCSLLTILFVYGIARMHAGEGAGLMAALVWALLPGDIFLATDLLPDGAMATFSTAAVFFLFLAERLQGYRRYLSYAAAVLSLLLALYIKPLSIVVLVFFVLYGLWKLIRRILPKAAAWGPIQNSRTRVILLAAASILILLAAAFYLSKQQPYHHFILIFTGGATDTLRLLTTNSLYWRLAPLFIVSAVSIIKEKRKTAAMPLFWAGTLFLYYEWGTITTDPLYYYPITIYFDPRNILFVMAALAVLCGIYLAANLPDSTARRLAAGASLVFIPLAFLSSRAAFSPTIDTISGNSAMLLVLLSIASPAFVFSNTKFWKTALIGLLLALMAFSVFSAQRAALSEHDKLRFTMLNVQKAARFLETQPEAEIYVFNKQEAMGLNYFSDFQFGFSVFDEKRPRQRIHIITPGEAPQASGYIVILDNSFPGTLPNWQKVTGFSQPPTSAMDYSPELTIYKAQPHE